MESIHIKIEPSPSGAYPISIGRDIIAKLGSLVDFSKYTKIAVITDDIVAPLWLDKCCLGIGKNSTRVIVPAGERFKNLLESEKIWTQLTQQGFDRKSLILNLGGGVIGDMGGFVASCYMRGIEFIQIPTTLLSQVDASVGGKVAIDFAGVKNLLGSFQQPQAVIIDLNTLGTLPEREFRAGFAEIIKHGLITDLDYFKIVNAHAGIDASHPALQDIVRRSCEIKAKVVELDEKESGLRKILNFGHTFGHAFEALALESPAPLLHGEAISIGMLAEAKLSELLGFISQEDTTQIEMCLKSHRLPVRLPIGLISGTQAHEKIITLAQADKKNVAGELRFSLLKKLGAACFDCTASTNQIQQALQYVI